MSKDSEVADTDESGRENMKQEPPHKLRGGQCHCALLIVVSRITPAERDLAIDQRNQAVIGDSHPVGVAAEILQHVIGASERPLGVDHPVATEQRSQHDGEGLGARQRSQRTVKAEFPARVKGPQTCYKLAAENAAEYPDGKEEAVLCGDPAAVV